jgi:hypothetical protein
MNSADELVPEAAVNEHSACHGLRANSHAIWGTDASLGARRSCGEGNDQYSFDRW